MTINPHYGADVFLISTAIPLGFLLNLILVCLVLRSKSLRAIPAFWLLVIVALASVWISFCNFNDLLFMIDNKSLLHTPFCGFLVASRWTCDMILCSILCVYMIDRIGTVRKLQSSDTQQSQYIPTTVVISLVVATIIGSVILVLILCFGTDGGIRYYSSIGICVLVGSSSPIVDLFMFIIPEFMFVMTTAIAFIPILVMWSNSKSGSTKQREVALPTILISIAVIVTVLPWVSLQVVLMIADFQGSGLYNVTLFFVLKFIEYWIHVLLPLIWILAGPIRNELCKSAAGEDPMHESSHLIMK